VVGHESVASLSGILWRFRVGENAVFGLIEGGGGVCGDRRKSEVWTSFCEQSSTPQLEVTIVILRLIQQHCLISLTVLFSDRSH
jgi:hypothetical protein